MRERHRPFILGVCAFLLSGVFLASQVQLSTLFNLLFQMDVRALASSVALFGYGVGGLMSAYRHSRTEISTLIAYVTLLTAAILALLFYLLLNAGNLKLITLAGFLTLVVLSFVYYVCAGIVITGITLSNRQHTHWLYAVDLCGGAVGTVISLTLSDWLGLSLVPSIFVLSLCIAAALLFWRDLGLNIRSAVFSFVALCLLAATPALNQPLHCDVKAPLSATGGQIAMAQSNSYSLVEMLPFDVTLELAEVTFIINCSIRTSGYKANDMDAVGSSLDGFRNVPFSMRKYDDTFVVGSGAGIDVIRALKSGGSHVEALEINPLIPKMIDVVRPDLRVYPYHDPRIRMVIGDAREYGVHKDAAFDLVLIAQVKNFGQPWGGQFLSAKPLYTKEAFETFIHSLRPNGILAIFDYAWSARQYTATLHAMSSEMGEDFREHTILISTKTVDSLEWVLYKKTPFTPEERRQAAQAAQKYNAQVIDPLEDSQGVLPLSDDRPFLLKPSGTTLASYRSESFYTFSSIPDLRGVGFVAYAVFIMFCMLGALMLWMRRSVPSSEFFYPVLYLALLGMSSAAIQFLLIYQTALLLGIPAYSHATVLVLILLSAAAGSYLAPWIRYGLSVGLLTILLIAFVILDAYIAGVIPWLVSSLNPLARTVTGATLVMVPGFLTGTLFLMIVRDLGVRDEGFAMWLWSIECFFFTATGFLSMIVALFLGFHAVSVISILALLCAFYISTRLRTL